MKNSPQRKLLVRFAFVAVVSSALGIGMVWGIGVVSGGLRRVEQGYETRSEIERASVLLDELEAAFRGYALTGSQGSLKRYASGRLSIRRAIESLGRLVTDDRDQRRHFEEWRRQAEAGLTDMEEIVAAVRSRGPLTGAGLARLADADRRLAGVRGSLRIVGDDVQSSLTRQSEREHRVMRAATGVAWVGVVGTLILLAYTYRRMAREAARRDRAEAALRESERRCRAIFDQTFQFVGLMDPDGTLLDANQTALEFAGVAREDVVGLPFWETPWWSHSPEDRDILKAAIRRASQGEFVRFETTHPDREGSVVAVDFSLKPVRDESGAVSLLIPEGREVTERRRIEEALRRSESQFRGCFEAAVTGMALVGIDGRWLQVNSSACSILGYSEEELLSTDFQAITHPDDLEVDLALVDCLIAGELPFYQLEKRYFHKQGHVIYAVLSASLIRDERDRPLYFVAQIEDITARKLAEAALRESEARFQAFMENSPAVALMKDAEGRYTYAAGPLAHVFEGGGRYLVGKRDSDWLPPEVARRVRENDLSVMATGRPSRLIESVPTREGLTRDWLLQSFPFRVEGRLMVGGVAVDITEQTALERKLAAANARLEALATSDPLTGLANRRLVGELLDSSVARSLRHRSALSVILIDVDHFKRFNDSFGHGAGDDALKTVAATLGATARDIDTVGRHGGEEFIVVAPETDAAGALALAERLRAAVGGRGWPLGPVTISLGVATWTPEVGDAAALVESADRALYASKQRGRNRVTHASELAPLPASAGPRWPGGTAETMLNYPSTRL